MIHYFHTRSRILSENFILIILKTIYFEIIKIILVYWCSHKKDWYGTRPDTLWPPYDIRFKKRYCRMEYWWYQGGPDEKWKLYEKKFRVNPPNGFFGHFEPKTVLNV